LKYRPWEDKRLNQLQRVDLPIFANKQPQLKQLDFPTLTSNLFLTETVTTQSTLQIQFVLIAEVPMLNPILFVQAWAEEVLRQVVDQEVGAPFRIRDLEPEQLMEVT
jgi:hypothetical protein